MIQTSRTLLIFLLGFLLTAPVIATTVLPISLERMSQRAELIFYGVARDNLVKIDEISGRVATFTTFETIEVIKGDVGNTHTIKQMGGQLPDSEVIHRVAGVPRFTVGDEYVVFLPQKSRLGFASPIGLSQGRFTVRKQNGISVVDKGRASKALLLRPSNTENDITRTIKPKGVTLAEFLQTVRGLASEE